MNKKDTTKTILERLNMVSKLKRNMIREMEHQFDFEIDRILDDAIVKGEEIPNYYWESDKMWAKSYLLKDGDRIRFIDEGDFSRWEVIEK